MYCFLRFFLKCVRVCERPFEMTVAVTVTRPGCTKGRPMREKSLVAASNTLSNVNLSPIFGGQYPSTTRRSPSVTRHCFPSKCTMAKFLDLFSSINLLQVVIISFVVSVADLCSAGAKLVAKRENRPPETKIIN